MSAPKAAAPPHGQAAPKTEQHAPAVRPITYIQMNFQTNVLFEGGDTGNLSVVGSLKGTYQTPPVATPYGLAHLVGPMEGVTWSYVDMASLQIELRDVRVVIQPTPWATDDASEGMTGGLVRRLVDEVFQMGWTRLGPGAFAESPVDGLDLPSSEAAQPASEVSPALDLT